MNDALRIAHASTIPAPAEISLTQRRFVVEGGCEGESFTLDQVSSEATPEQVRALAQKGVGDGVEVKGCVVRRVK
jgi:hypothetical protein